MKSSKDTPRPEYPRPQFARAEWMSLNGVPYPYQSELSGVGDKSIHEVFWYARGFEVPEEWQRGRDLLLHFGAVDYSTTLWVTRAATSPSTSTSRLT